MIRSTSPRLQQHNQLQRVSASKFKAAEKVEGGKENDYAQFKRNCVSFSKVLQNRKDQIAKVLADYQSYNVVDDEVTRTAECLTSIDDIKQYMLSDSVSQTSVFFPLNLPVYSLVLFGIVPSFLSDKVIIRPPQKMMAVFDQLLPLLDLDRLFPNIEICFQGREDFVNKYASKADVVIFTGRDENAVRVLKQCKKHCLFLFNGWGANPVVVAPDANIALAAAKTAEVKVFNSGQDCAGPDTVLVHKNVATDFVQQLTRKLAQIKVGDYLDRTVEVGKIAEYEQLSKVSSFLVNNHKNIVFGGKIDFAKALVEPTVIVSPLKTNKNYQELFAPVCFVNVYDSDSELDSYFSAPQYRQNAMYASLFGSSQYVSSALDNTIVLKESTILDIESGNSAYGGYSMGASFVSSSGVKEARPILIPKEIAMFKKQQFSLSLQPIPKKSRATLIANFQTVVPTIFNENLGAGFIFGGIAKGYAKLGCDIDTMVMLHQHNSAQEVKYIRYLRHLHDEHDCVVDEEYPAEIVDLPQLDDAIRRMPDVTLKLSGNSADTFDRVVWGEVLAGRKSGIVGDQELLRKYTVQCAKFPKLWRQQVLGAMEQGELPTNVIAFAPGQSRENALKEVRKMDTGRLLRKFVEFEESDICAPYSSIA